MNKERYNQIIDEVFINYCQTKIEKTSTGEIWISYAGHYGIISKEEFINKCKTDPEFSETWGLTIEERELTLEERHQISLSRIGHNGIVDRDNMSWHETYNKTGIPTKIITLTYQNEKIESYE